MAVALFFAGLTGLTETRPLAMVGWLILPGADGASAVQHAERRAVHDAVAAAGPRISVRPRAATGHALPVAWHGHGDRHTYIFVVGALGGALLLR
jgi:hypothetical protein